MRRRLVVLGAVVVVLLVVGVAFPEYIRLLRPRALKQLTPDMVRLVNELPDMDRQNEQLIGRLFAHGGLDRVEEDDATGVMRAEIRVPEGDLLWNPAILVMPHAGELAVEIFNDDPYVHHAAILPSNGDKQYMNLPIRSRGTARLELDGPGYYWFGCPVANHVGRGMLGLILVGGDVPDEGRLDRPEQARP